jgi:signal transduction histidine kinase
MVAANPSFLKEPFVRCWRVAGTRQLSFPPRATRIAVKKKHALRPGRCIDNRREQPKMTVMNRPTSLLTRLIFGLTIIVFCMGVLGFVAVTNMLALRLDMNVAESAQRELRHLYMAGVHVMQAENHLRSSELTLAKQEVQRAIARLDERALGLPPAGADFNRFRTLLREASQASELAGQSSALRRAITEASTVDGIQKARLRDAAEAAEGHRRHAVVVTIVSCMLLVMLSAALSWHLYRRIRAPLCELGEFANAIASGNREARLSLHADREFNDLGRNFNLMAERLKALCEMMEAELAQHQAAIVQSQRSAQIGLLAAGAMHELATPLSLIACQSELAVRQHDLAALDGIREESLRCQNITRSFLDLVQSADVSERRCNVDAVIRGVLDKLMLLHPDASSAHWTIDCSAELTAMISRGAFEQVMFNLLTNAVRAVRKCRGRVQVVARNSDGRCAVTVSDNGYGIEKAQLQSLFVPLFTTDSVAGHGLGLYVCKHLVTCHQGSITARSEGPGSGAQFTVILPLACEEQYV